MKNIDSCPASSYEEHPKSPTCNAKEIHLLIRLGSFARFNWSPPLRSNRLFHSDPDKIGTSLPPSASAFERPAGNAHV